MGGDLIIPRCSLLAVATGEPSGHGNVTARTPKSKLTTDANINPKFDGGKILNVLSIGMVTFSLLHLWIISCPGIV
jgi:hypothetical protein